MLLVNGNHYKSSLSEFTIFKDLLHVHEKKCTPRFLFFRAYSFTAKLPQLKYILK